MTGFRARARTVDLLGRQQIAGIPTAVSELFKNAHDAYANRVEVDFFRDRQLLVLRDDGYGMDGPDFVDRWLTLGTDSKVDSERGLELPSQPARNRRPILGEKGIGRLAIAAIGPQVLVLTRAIKDGELSDLTVALVNWRLFELPGVNLEQIDIPILTLEGGSLPGKKELKRLADRHRRQIKKLELNPEEAGRIAADLELLDFDPKLLLEFLGEPSLAGHGHGTQFLVVPTSEQLPADLDSGDEKSAPPLVQTLIGFANTMLPESPKPRIATAFRDRPTSDAQPRELIGPSSFFTPEDYALADHRIFGTFDEMGDFAGSISVYGGDAQPYDFIWTGGGRRPLRCGPFHFDLAYVQGDAKDSSLGTADHARLTRKLDQIGGLYIYRDGIRVLPYGTPGFDFLEIERRRSENVGRYFFSYRRMFGVVSLDNFENGALEEKAGREGFVQNQAYRQFRDLLKSFFANVAAEFFASRGDRSDEFFKGREAARKRHDIERQNSERTRKERERFEKRVGALIAQIEKGNPQIQANDLLEKFRAETTELEKDAGIEAIRQLQNAETRILRELSASRDGYLLVEPAGVGLSREQRKNWDYLQEQVHALDAAVWEPAESELIRIASATYRRLPKSPTRRQQVEAGIASAVAQAEEDLAISQRGLEASIGELAAAAKAEAKTGTERLKEATEEAFGTTRAKDLSRLSEDDFIERRASAERAVREAGRHEADRISEIASRLESIATTIRTADQPTAEDVASVLEEEILALRDRADRDLELAQLGMATEVISHELDSTIVGIRSALNQLNAFAEVNAPLRPLRDEIRTGFDHLDTYLALFTPLQRRLTRRRATIKGSEIASFVADLFADRFKDEEIELQVTDAFVNWKHSGFRSTIYPVFVNLVDNASYWVTQNRPPRWIQLDSKRDSLLVADSGRGIPGRDEDSIWAFGFTRKPGGRGAGLHISKEVLARDGWNLDLVREKDTPGAVFRVTPPRD